MRVRHHLATLLTIAGVLAAPLSVVGCAGHSARIYDPVYDRYYAWNHTEDRLYRRWELETRVRHVDFARRPVAEQRAYFQWRHGR